jgi:S1-C subfamily serine protease
MKKLLAIGSMALLCAALGVGTTAFAGGGEDCHGKSDATSAQNSKHECNMSAEACAQEMQKNLATRGWLGIVMDQSDEAAMTITKVYPGSPAEQAGFRTGDKIVSLNGVQVNDKNEEKIHGMLKKAKIGEQVTYVVERGSDDVTLKATLAQIPQDVLTASIDEHMKADHAVAKN